MIIYEKLKQLPERPGIYKMLDPLGNIIYVGKAVNLKRRVSQYFHNQKGREPKVEEMIQNISDFDFQALDTELDALIEECRLIKKIKPLYNRQMKNTQRYSYLKILKESYPRIIIVTEKTEDGATYFGPFTSPQRVESALQYINSFYPIRKCTKKKIAKTPDGCMFKQLGACLGVCTGQISQEDYSSYIQEIQNLINGDRQILQKLLTKIDMAVEQLDFEKAAQLKAYYQGLRHVIAKQKLVYSSQKNRNVLAVEYIDSEYGKLFFIKGNKLLRTEIFNRSTIKESEFKDLLNQSIQNNFAPSTQASGLHGYDLDEEQIITSYLRLNKTRIMSFWIPASQLRGELLESRTMKIVARLTSA
jgi:excinuclease ABC subunit C